MSAENERRADAQMRMLSQSFFEKGWRVKSMDVFDCGGQMGFILYRDQGVDPVAVSQHIELCGWTIAASHANDEVIVMRIKTNGAKWIEVER